MDELPSVLADIVEEYKGAFRIKEEKIDIWGYDAVRLHEMKEEFDREKDFNIFRDPSAGWTLIGTYTAAPGLWELTQGSFIYEMGATYIPFILHKNDFDISTLPSISIKRKAERDVSDIVITTHIERREEIRIEEELDDEDYEKKVEYKDERTIGSCEGKILRSYTIGAQKYKEGLPLSLFIQSQTYTITVSGKIVAIVFIAVRATGTLNGKLENDVLRAIADYIQRLRIEGELRDLQEKLPNHLIRSLGQGQLVIQNKEFALDPERYGGLKYTNNDRLWGDPLSLELFSGRRSDIIPPVRDLDLLRSDPIKYNIKRYFMCQLGVPTGTHPITLDMPTLYKKIMTELEGKEYKKIVVDSDSSYHVEN